VGNRSQAQIQALTEPWHAFLEDAFPDGTSDAKSRRSGRKPGTDTSEASRWLRVTVKQPSPKNVWDLARRARRLGPANAWCAGPLFLWAAGHFADFSRVMIGAEIPVPRKIGLLANVLTACAPQPAAASRAQRKAALIAAGYTEIEAQAATENLVPSGRRDRVIWELDDDAIAAFNRSFTRSSDIPPGPSAVAAFTCEAVARHTKHGIDHQKTAILEALRHGMGL
jgi:hypothetical protein